MPKKKKANKVRIAKKTVKKTIKKTAYIEPSDIPDGQQIADISGLELEVDGIVSVMLPLGPVPPGSSEGFRRVDKRLTVKQGVIVHRLWSALREHHLKLENGRYVNTAADAYTWLFEQLERGVMEPHANFASK